MCPSIVKKIDTNNEITRKGNPKGLDIDYEVTDKLFLS
jgi:hypothetical protein